MTPELESAEAFTTRLCDFVYDQVPGSTGMGYLIEPLIRQRDAAVRKAALEEALSDVELFWHDEILTRAESIGVEYVVQRLRALAAKDPS